MSHLDSITGQPTTDAGDAAFSVSRAISRGALAAPAFAAALSDLAGLVEALSGDPAQAGADLRVACAELADWHDTHPDKFAPAVQRRVAAALRALATN